MIVSEEKWTLYNVRNQKFEMLLDIKAILNAYSFLISNSFNIFCITTPSVFLNQTDLVRLGIFHLELGKNILFGFGNGAAM